MAYIKNNWVDREGVIRYFETIDEDGALIFTPDFTQITEMGTPVNADNMNHIENGIFDLEVRMIKLEQDFELKFDAGDKKDITNWSFPSNHYDNLTLGTSGISYTAPANGWVNIEKKSTATGQYMRLSNNSVGIRVRTNNTHGTDQSGLLLPVAKGDTFTVEYTYDGTTDRFIFIYANGEV